MFPLLLIKNKAKGRPKKEGLRRGSYEKYSHVDFEEGVTVTWAFSWCSSAVPVELKINCTEAGLQARQLPPRGGPSPANFTGMPNTENVRVGIVKS
jgi:hypothetical protein